MSLTVLLACAGVCAGAVLLALGAASLGRLITERLIRTVSIQFRRSRVTPRNTMVKSGTITMMLMNEEQEPHRLRIRSPELELTSPTVSPGRTQEWRVHLTSGVYYLSLFPVDREQESEESSLRVLASFLPEEAV